MTTNKDQGLSTRLENFLESDDDVSFVNQLREQPPINFDIINSLVNKCVESDALKCLIALIRGEVCNMHPKFDSAKLPDSGVTPLAYIAHSCPEDSQLIDLMLTKCGATCLANVYCTIGVIDGLPIHFLLINLSVMEHLYSWKRETSLIKLVMLLCLWETKPVLDTLGVLVKYTDSINGIAWSFLKNGGLKQFTALLLIAGEKVIAPFDSGLTIHHYITSEIDLHAQGELCLEQKEWKCCLKDAQTLLTLFELIGDDLSSYRSSMKKYVFVDDMIEDICYLLVKHKAIVGMQDMNLDDCIPRNKEYLGRAVSDSIDAHPWELVGRFDANYIDRRCYLPSEVRPFDCSNPPKIRSTYKMNAHFGQRLPIPKCLQGRLYSTEACQAKDMSKSLACTSVSPVPRHLGYIPMKFINRIRFM
ncbi:uncharacterized protein LOC141646480 [Silene latifolia]|uniref:uncharacterized protein LOC141646480 n=1 Tax=Silene latifolia TaxID=37657 RepID=UPI003D76FF01